MDYIKYILTGVAGGILVIIVVLLTGIGGGDGGGSNVGSNATTTISNPHVYTNSISIGTTTAANTISRVFRGKCEILDYNVIQVSSSTKAYDCSVSGVESTDLVFAQFSTSTAPGSGLATFMTPVWDIVSAKASTTNGYITVLIRNDGPNKRPSDSGIASSTEYLIIR